MKEVLVWPRDDAIKQHLRHPMGNRFANYPEGTPWPNDQFTKRRVGEGAITTTNPKPAYAPRRSGRRSSSTME